MEGRGADRQIMKRMVEEKGVLGGGGWEIRPTEPHLEPFHIDSITFYHQESQTLSKNMLQQM